MVVARSRGVEFTEKNGKWVSLGGAFEAVRDCAEAVTGSREVSAYLRKLGRMKGKVLRFFGKED